MRDIACVLQKRLFCIFFSFFFFFLIRVFHFSFVFFDFFLFVVLLWRVLIDAACLCCIFVRDFDFYLGFLTLFKEYSVYILVLCIFCQFLCLRLFCFRGIVFFLCLSNVPCSCVALLIVYKCCIICMVWLVICVACPFYECYTCYDVQLCVTFMIALCIFVHWFFFIVVTFVIVVYIK